jgi:methylmalonyl-CoA mutase N-terminal domain/subunit
VVGVNRYKPDVADDIPMLKVDNSSVRKQQLEKLARLKAERDPAATAAALRRWRTARAGPATCWPWPSTPPAPRPRSARSAWRWRTSSAATAR